MTVFTVNEGGSASQGLREVSLYLLSKSPKTLMASARGNILF